MKKIIIFFLLTILVPQHITAMKRARPASNNIVKENKTKKIALAKDDEPQELCQDLVLGIFEHFPRTLQREDCDFPKRIQDQIMSTSLVNKQLYSLIHSPGMSLLIARKLFPYIQAEDLARKIKTPGLRNYVSKSRSLYYHFTERIAPTHEQIKDLVTEGADLNYIPLARQRPMIYEAHHNYENLKTLLELGADINKKFKCRYMSCLTTILSHMIRYEALWEKNLEEYYSEEYYSIVQLLLSYNPLDKCLDYVIETKNSRLLELVLQNNVPINQLNMALSYAVEKQYIRAIQPLLSAGADANRGFQKASALKRCFAQTFYPFRNEQDKEQFLEIIKILCAWTNANFEDYINNYIQ